MTSRIRILLLLGAAAIVYSNTLVNGFVYDDGFYVLRNTAVTNFSLPGMFRPMPGSHTFRPLTSIIWATEWKLEGPHPFGFHLLNLLLHVVVTLLLYFVLRKLLEETEHAEIIAFVAALLFAVHPIHTEAVAWVAGRSELLAAGFLLAAWLLHLQDRPFAAVGCFVLALLSKESAVVFLPMVVAGDYLRGEWKGLLRYGWLAGVTALYVAVLWKVQGGRFDKGPYSWMDNPLPSLPFTWRILNALRIAWKYVALQLYPAKLSCDYSYAAIRLYADWKHTLPALLATLALLLAWMWAVATRRRAWALAGVLYLGGFAVTSNLIVSTGTIMGERLAYLPSAGFCLLVALVWMWIDGRSRLVSVTLALAVLGLFSVRTVLRNRDWRNELTLYSAEVKVAPESARAHGLLGQEYLRLGRLDAADIELKQALAIFPEFPSATENYGLLQSHQGHDKEARRYLEKATQLTGKGDPDHTSMTITFAAWLLQHGEEDKALQILNPIIVEFPDESRAWSNRAVIRYRKTDLAGAREDAERALVVDPGNTQAQSLLSAVQGLAKRPEAPPTDATKSDSGSRE